jgi:hypothetical protein
VLIQIGTAHPSKAGQAHADLLAHPTNLDLLLVADGFAKQLHQAGIGALSLELVKRIAIEIIISVLSGFLFQLILQEFQLVFGDYPQELVRVFIVKVRHKTFCLLQPAAASLAAAPVFERQFRDA